MDVSLTTLSGFLSQQPASVMHLICIHQVSSTIGKTSEEVFLATRGIVPFSRSVLWVSLPSPTGYPEVTVGHAPAVGIARTIRNEYPDMRFVTLSIAEAVMKHDIETAIIDAAQLHAFQNRDRGGDHEPEFHSEIIENVATLSVPRLSYSHKAAELLNVPSTENVDVDRLFKDPNKPDLALTMTLPGLLDTLTFVPDTQPHKALLPTEILIDPKYVGLNFLDVLTALGQIPQNAVLGIEGAGIVVQAGTASGYQPGDRVAMLADGTLRTSVKADHRTAVKIPDSVTLADAASMAGTACTAYRSLVDIANLDSSESILIHAGAGATGQMAIQMARHIGAEVFTTVGSERKRDLLEVAYHIPASHIFHSRNASFIHAIKRMTNGRGVDVVLNSLSGSLLESAWLESIAPFGRWVEIGKRDIVENRGLPMRPFLNNVTFSCLDLTGLWRQRPQMMQKLLKDVFRLVAQGVLRPPTPIMEFGVNEIRAAFRTLQSNKEGGKVIINMTGQQRLTVKQAVSTDWGFKNKRSYLIVGGFGGLGREVARWMVNRGARYLIIVSRTGAGQDPVRATLLDELRAVGCSPTVMSCNISNKAALQAVLAECEKKLPPIAGCIQASMVLRVSPSRCGDGMIYSVLMD
jgi:NADPH:quinone reductase-like Zn-dependent oxidoreductase